MTVSEEARDRLGAFGVSDRQEAMMVAKCVAQRIIDESKGSDEPLSSLVYDVWGLYNEGTPKCRFTMPYENDDLVFAGQFHLEDSDAFVVRRKVLTDEDVQAALDEVNNLRGL